MSVSVDRMRVAAVEVLKGLGYTWDGTQWKSSGGEPAWPEADRLHALLMDRAEVLSGCIEDSPEEDELKAIAEALEAYEERRWPDGKIPGGKG